MCVCESIYVLVCVRQFELAGMCARMFVCGLLRRVCDEYLVFIMVCFNEIPQIILPFFSAIVSKQRERK